MRKHLNEARDVIEEALRGIPVDWIIGQARRHPFVKLTAANGQSRKVFFPGTTTDWRAPRQLRCEVRRACRELGLQLAQGEAPPARADCEALEEESTMSETIELNGTQATVEIGKRRKTATHLEIARITQLLVAHCLKTSPDDPAAEYEAGWSDERIAEDVGGNITERHVRDLRREIIGPLASECKLLEAPVTPQVFAQVLQRLSALEKRVDDVETLVLEKHA